MDWFLWWQIHWGQTLCFQLLFVLLPDIRLPYGTGYLGLPPSQRGAVTWITQRCCVLKIVFDLSQRKSYLTNFNWIWICLVICSKLFSSLLKNVDFKSTFFPSIFLSLSWEQNTVIRQQLCLKKFSEESICCFPNIFLFSFCYSDSVDTKSPQALWCV